MIAATTVVWKRPSIIIISSQFPAELAEFGDNYVNNYVDTVFTVKRNELDGYNGRQRSTTGTASTTSTSRASN